MEKQNQSRVVRGRVELWVPHNNGEIAFAYPSVTGNYRDAGANILKHGQKVPTGDYIASLVHTAYCDESVANEPEFANVRDVVKNRWLWVFNRNFWNNNGVYVIQDNEAIGRSQPLDVQELEKMLKGGREVDGIRFSNDKRVRFAPKESYVLGNHTPESLAKDGFMVASCGKDGAEKLGEASSKFRNTPYTFGLDIEAGQAPEQRVSALDEDDCGLRFGGDCSDLWVDGRAFGVL